MKPDGGWAPRSTRDALRCAEFLELVVAAQAGDRRAVGELLALPRPELARYCSTRLGAGGARCSVEDVVQEICLGVLKALPGFADPPERFLRFVYGIAAHKVADWHRKRYRDKSCHLADVPGVAESWQAAGPSTEHRVTQVDLVARLRPVFDSLPTRQRIVLALRYVDCLSYDEIGSRLGGSAVAARVVHCRAMKVLRSHVAELDWR